MRCWIVRRCLPLHSGSDLPRWLDQRVETHVEECAGCRQELDAFRRALGRLRELSDSVEGMDDLPVGLAIDRSASGRRGERAIWTCARAACVLLAACGTLALSEPFGARAERIGEDGAGSGYSEALKAYARHVRAASKEGVFGWPTLQERAARRAAESPSSPAPATPPQED